MEIITYKINDPVGLHARPAGLLVKESSKYNSEIMIECNGKCADSKKIFSVMNLGARCGDELKIHITGNDEKITAKKIKEFLKENL